MVQNISVPDIGDFKDVEVIEIEVNHRPRIKGKSNYGFERVIRVLIDLIFMNF